MYAVYTVRLRCSLCTVHKCLFFLLSKPLTSVTQKYLRVASAWQIDIFMK